MAERAPRPDNASQSSEDSVLPPPRLDRSRIKAGPGALAADAFDPLRHEDWERFWASIDNYFQPINQDDVRFLRSVPVNPFGGCKDHDLRLTPRPMGGSVQARRNSVNKARERTVRVSATGAGPTQSIPGAKLAAGAAKKTSIADTASGSLSAAPVPVAMDLTEDDDPLTMPACLNAYPFTHRLVAALLDEGGPGGTPPPSAAPARANRSGGGGEEPFWAGVGAEDDLRGYQLVLEDRVKIELIDIGLLDRKEDDALQTAMRHEQWKLRDCKTRTRVRKSSLYTLIIGSELRLQAVRREIKRHNDKVEMAYLDRMVRNLKKNKKSRSKFQKLLQRMFAHYKDKGKNKTDAGGGMHGRLLTAGDEKHMKKKKKKGDHGPVAAKGPVSKGKGT